MASILMSCVLQRYLPNYQPLKGFDDAIENKPFEVASLLIQIVG